MRMYRLLTAVLAFCLIGFVPFATSTSANAAEHAGAVVSSSAPSAFADTATADRAKTTRKISFNFKTLSRTSYKFIGKVQGANKKKITLLRSNSKKGKYRTFRTTRTSSTGHYKFNKLGKTGWFAVKVPSDKKYKTSYSKLIHVFYS